MFTVYTYFGRVLAEFGAGNLTGETLHHEALESARKYLVQYESETSKPAWIKYT